MHEVCITYLHGVCVCVKIETVLNKESMSYWPWWPWPLIPWEQWSRPIYMRKVEVKGHSVQSWSETDGCMEPVAFSPMLTQSLIKHISVTRNIFSFQLICTYEINGARNIYCSSIYFILLAWDVIYTSCAYPTMSVSVWRKCIDAL